MGGKSFTIPCTVTRNGLGVKTASLLDTGANSFPLINTSIADRIAEFTGACIEPLPQEIPVKGFDGNIAHSATSYIRLHMRIDGRSLYNVPFVILDLGNHDILLGRKWLSYLDLKLDVRKRRIIWPEECPRVPSFVRLATTSILDLQDKELDTVHQIDASQRDQAIDREICKEPKRILRILKRPVTDLLAGVTPLTQPVIPTLPENPARARWVPKDLVKHTEQIDYADNLRKMEQELNNTRPLTPSLTPPLADRKAPVTAPVDIALIGPVGFYRNLTLPDSIPFVTSLYEIDRLLTDRITDKTDPEELTDQELVARKLPEQYHNFKDVFSKEASDTLPPHRLYDHKIELEGTSTLGFSPLYQQSAAELQATKQYILDNLHKGFIEPSQAPFASPVLFVKKANGGLRFCIDYRKLNNLTRKDRYPLPLLDETLNRMSNAKIFTKLDIRQAFHRIRIDPESEDLTTFRTRYGTYKCKVLPFGLTNGPATYQRYMNDTLFDYLDNFCTAYLDDIMIYSENIKDHQEHVRKVLLRLRKAGLQADIKKSEFGVTRTKYLGFIISTDGIEPDPEKTTAISQWEPPRTVKGVQSFLGFCNFYRRFIKDFGRVARPLNQLTRKDTVFVFDQSCIAAFKELKRRLTTAPLLAHFDPQRTTQMETDSSDGVVAGVLSQLQTSGLYQPVAYFSKTMIEAELNYPIHDKEMLAIVLCFQHWRVHLAGNPQIIQVVSDHKALEYFMTTKALTARQARWAEVLSQYNLQIAYKPGAQNHADALTRREQDTDNLLAMKISLRTQTLLPAERLDPQIRKEPDLEPLDQTGEIALATDHNLIDSLLTANRTASSLTDLRKKADNPQSNFDIRNGLLLYQDRLVVPDHENLRTEIIREAHAQKSTAHPGQGKTRKILTDRYFWPGMATDINRYIRNCHDCRRSTIPRDKTPGLLKPLPIPERPWQHISLDFHEVPRDKAGYDMILVIIDRFSKRSFSLPCHKTITAKETAELFIHYIYRIYGPPDTIVSDRGPQFISAFWNEFTRILGIRLKLSTANHPQTDGQTENLNQWVDQRLRSFANYFQDNWSQLLPIMDFAQACLPHTATGFSPIELEMGYKPRTSFDWDRPIDQIKVTDKLSYEQARELAKRMHATWE